MKSEITKDTRMRSFLKTERIPKRLQVLDIIGNKEMTAHEVAYEMYNKGLLPYPARAIIQPRLTELVEKGLLEVIGDKLDMTTNRSVAIYCAKRDCFGDLKI